MTIHDVTQSVHGIISSIIESAAIFIPRIFWAIVLVGIGWVVSWIFKKITLKMVAGLDQIFLKKVEQQGLTQVYVKHRYGPFFAEAVFWTLFLFFLLLGIQVLQIEFLSLFLQNSLNNLPRLAIGIVIVFTSFFAGSVASQIVTKAFWAMEVEQANLLGKAVKVVVVFMGILLGIDQIGLDISILNTIVNIFIAAVLGGIALAFGVGAKTYVENIISAVQIRRIYQNGDVIKIDNVEGKIIEMTPTMVNLQSAEGQISMPAKLFLEKTSYLVNPLERDES